MSSAPLNSVKAENNGRTESANDAAEGEKWREERKWAFY